MRHAIIALFVLPVFLLSGCGGSSVPSVTPSPHHAGSMIALPGARGFVELVTARGSSTRGGPKGQEKTRMTAYFYQADGTSEMSPAPSKVELRIGASGSGTVVNFAAEPKEAGKFVSEPGTYPDAFPGQIDATINGESVSAPFTIR